MSTTKLELDLPIGGMSCAACAMNAEKTLKASKGVLSATVNYASRSVRLTYEPEMVSLETLQSGLKAIGYELLADSADKLAVFEKLEQSRLASLRKKLFVSLVFSLPVFVLSMILHHPGQLVKWLFLGLSLPVIFYAGGSFYSKAWKLALSKQTSMDTLIVLGTGAAFVISLMGTLFPSWFVSNGLTGHVYYESAVVIITLVLLGRYLEEKSRGKASAAIRSLMSLQPGNVTVVRNGAEESVTLKEVNSGDLVLVKPGNRIPVDGTITEGSSWIEESMMTGEPLPVFKQAGDSVMAGTLNRQGSFTILTQKAGRDTALAHIIGMVEQARASKPPVQKLVDRISSVFVPLVIVVALATFAGWYFMGPEPALNYAIITSISVLVIACPCALGLATPTALIVAIGHGAGKGILFRDASSLEEAGKTNVLVVDKTGTLTHGKPEAGQITTFGETGEIYPLFAGLTKLSLHPLSSAISGHLIKTGINPVKFEEINEIPGKGVSGRYNLQTYYAGSRSLIEEMKIPVGESGMAFLQKMEKESGSLVLFASDERLLAVASVTDQVRDDSAPLVRALRKMNIGVVMLTGDHDSAARSVAALTGITRFEAGLSPESKAMRIRELQNDGNRVAMAGDGINDTIALTQADAGIAMGTGSEASMAAAAITITGSSLNQIVETIKLSKTANRIIKQNLFWAFFYNLLTLPLAAGLFFSMTHQLLDPMVASAAMALSSVSVVANSLRIRNS